jgi:hypothetical protein
MLATKQARFYFSLRHLENVFAEALPSNILFQIVGTMCFKSPLSSNGLFRHRGSTFLQNVGNDLQYYKASSPEDDNIKKIRS